jgi:hypothetical protein
VGDPGDAEIRARLDEYLAEDSWLRAEQLLRSHTTAILGPGSLRMLREAGGGDGATGEALRARRHLAFLTRCAQRGLDDVFPALASYVDPLVTTPLYPAMARADAAEAVYDERGEVAAIAASAAQWREILASPSLANAWPGLLAALLNNAGGVLLKAAFAGEPLVLAEAVTLLRDAAALTPPGSALLAGRLGNLGLALWQTYRCARTNEAALLEAVRLLRAAVAAARQDSARVDATANLALALQDLYLLAGDVSHLDEAVAACDRQLADTATRAAPAQALQVQLGNLLRWRAAARSDRSDLERSVGVLEASLGAARDRSAELPRRRVNLAVVLLDRNARDGDPADLGRALDQLAAASREMSHASADWPNALLAMGLAQLRRHDVTGALDALDDAVAHLDAALANTPDQDLDEPLRATALGTALRERAEATGRTHDLDRAVGLFRLAAENTPATSPLRPAFLTNLGNALHDRMTSPAGTNGDLDAAVEALDAAACTDEGGFEQETITTNLSLALLDRYRIQRSRADLDRAAALMRGFSDRIDKSRTDAPRRLVALGLVLAERFDADGDPGDRRAAGIAYARGCTAGLDLHPESTVRGGQFWSAWAASHGDRQAAARGLELALTSLERAVHTQVLREHKESWLNTAGDLATRAAWVAAWAGDPARATGLLETGRAMVLTEALRRDRADLARLGEQHPGLAARFRACAQRMRALEQDRVLAASLPRPTGR